MIILWENNSLFKGKAIYNLPQIPHRTHKQMSLSTTATNPQPGLLSPRRDKPYGKFNLLNTLPGGKLSGKLDIITTNAIKKVTTQKVCLHTILYKSCTMQITSLIYPYHQKETTGSERQCFGFLKKGQQLSTNHSALMLISC